MEYQEYLNRAGEAARLVDEGRLEEARALLEEIVESEISARDRAMMCLNLAVVSDKRGEMAEALRWYDRGIAYERSQGQIFVAESKAVYLARKGRVQDSLRLYESLLGRGSLDEATMERLRRNIATLRATEDG